METYVALNRQYTVATDLTTASDTKLRRTLIKYRLSEHNMAVEVGRHRQTWLSREERLCSYCDQGTVERDRERERERERKRDRERERAMEGDQ